MKLNNIPVELKEHNYWCVWKDKKIPYNPKTNACVRSNDPDTFADFGTACKALNSGNYTGLGIGIFNGIGAIDIDHCYNNGELSDMAKDIINKMNSYTEVSPSGTGIRIIFTVKDFEYNKEIYYIHNHKRKLEIYISGATNKYVTITGDLINNYSIVDGTTVLPQILDTYMKRPQNKNEQNNTYISNNNLTDSEFLNIGLKKDKKLSSYWQGSRPHKSESENDLGFMNKLLYWCNKNEDLTLHSFLSSPYVSQKDDKHKKKLERKDYIANLIKTGMPSSTAAEQYAKYCEQNKKKHILSDDKNSQNNESTKKALATPNIISAQDLQKADLPPIQYLVEDILPEGTSLLSASPKMGKSWFVLDMGLKIASGENFLNKKTVKNGVLYLALEDSYQRLQDRTNKILQNRIAPEGFYFFNEAPSLDENLLSTLEGYIKQYPEIKLIIIDTLQKIRSKAPVRGNIYQQDYADIGALKSFADKNKLSLILVHHNRKMKDPENNFNMISGTNGIMGAADTIFMIDKESRKDINATLHITGRDVQENNIVIHFNQNKFCWEVIGDEYEIAEKNKERAYKNSLIVKTIKSLLSESPENKWSGTATQLLKAGQKICNMPIAVSCTSLGKKLTEDFDKQLFRNDKIIHKTQDNGNAGKIHHFYNFSIFVNSDEFGNWNNDEDDYTDIEF